MTFKIKDLMVSVLPSEEAGGDRVLIDRTDCTRTNNTGQHILAIVNALANGECLCTLMFCESTHPFPPVPPIHTWRSSPEALATLKGQLKQQLAEVERQQADAEDNLLPKTVEEVEMLANKLTDALSELKTRRIELEKKPKPPGEK